MTTCVEAIDDLCMLKTKLLSLAVCILCQPSAYCWGSCFTTLKKIHDWHVSELQRRGIERISVTQLSVIPYALLGKYVTMKLTNAGQGVSFVTGVVDKMPGNLILNEGEPSDAVPYFIVKTKSDDVVVRLDRIVDLQIHSEKKYDVRSPIYDLTRYADWELSDSRSEVNDQQLRILKGKIVAFIGVDVREDGIMYRRARIIVGRFLGRIVEPADDINGGEQTIYHVATKNDAGQNVLESIEAGAFDQIRIQPRKKRKVHP